MSKESCHCGDPALDAGDVGRNDLHFVRNDIFEDVNFFKSFAMVMSYNLANSQWQMADSETQISAIGYQL